MEHISFSDIAIVSCGTLRMELTRLKKEGFLDTEHIFFTTPGLHQDIHELERQLVQTIQKAKEKVNNFPRHSDGAILLDAIGFLEKYMTEKPEEFLDYCDWMGIPMQAYPTTLERLKSLFVEAAKKL